MVSRDLSESGAALVRIMLTKIYDVVSAGSVISLRFLLLC